MVDKLVISERISIPMTEIEMSAVRSQGAGGQNVNKVATAVHLRFDAANSPSLPTAVRDRLLDLGDRRVTDDGVIVIKSQQSRSQARNREDALRRLADLVRQATVVRKTRKVTRPSKKARQARRDDKMRRGRLKSLRRKPPTD